MRIPSVFDNLPQACLICALSIMIYIYNIMKWGDWSSESGAIFRWVSCPVSLWLRSLSIIFLYKM